jgi:hypothetical protein
MAKNGKEFENLDFSSVAATFEKAITCEIVTVFTCTCCPVPVPANTSSPKGK